jgi:hypothetical protein
MRRAWFLFAIVLVAVTFSAQTYVNSKGFTIDGATGALLATKAQGVHLCFDDTYGSKQESCVPAFNDSSALFLGIKLEFEHRSAAGHGIRHEPAKIVGERTPIQQGFPNECKELVELLRR